MRRQSSITFIGVNSGTPVNEKLCGKYLQTFAYTTIKDRLPVILTKVIDQLARDKEEIIGIYGNEAEECIKAAIGKISKLKNEVQTNKPLLPIESAGEGVAEWNSYLEELEKDGPVSWYQAPWLYTENYMYRRLQEIFETSKSLKGFDPFRKQKIEAFEAALPQLAPLAHALKEKYDPSLDSFATALKLSLWSNRCDLSLSNGTVEAHEDNGLLSNIHDLDKLVLADDSEKTFQALSKHSSNIVDFVHDNAAYELFTDLCVADYLVSSGLAGTVRLRVKRFPWYVSDATVEDISWLLDRLPAEGLGAVADRWREHLSMKRWQILADKFWTLPFAYSEMKTRDPALYSSLAEAALVIFKGDLNYRKLVGDVNWTFSKPFASALLGFRPSNILALRTIKADVVCGLTPGQTEELFQKEPMWMRTGEYGLMQLSESAHPSP